MGGLHVIARCPRAGAVDRVIELLEHSEPMPELASAIALRSPPSHRALDVFPVTCQRESFWKRWTHARRCARSLLNDGRPLRSLRNRAMSRTKLPAFVVRAISLAYRQRSDRNALSDSSGVSSARRFSLGKLRSGQRTRIAVRILVHTASDGAPPHATQKSLNKSGCSTNNWRSSTSG